MSKMLMEMILFNSWKNAKEGEITRMKKTNRGVEQSIWMCMSLLIRYHKDESWRKQRIHRVGRVIESDHNPDILEMNLQFSKFKSERIEIFNFNYSEAQKVFRNLTTNTSVFLDSLQTNLPFEIQAMNLGKFQTNCS